MPNSSRKKRSLSNLISALLLVVIVVAGAALIYAYLVGFIGNETHIPSAIQITGFCASTSSHCSGGIYSVSIDNIGTGPVSGTFSFSFTDSTTGLGAATTGCANTALTPGSTLVCTAPVGTTWTGLGFIGTPSVGDQVTVTVVAADGGTAISYTKVII